MVGHSWSMWYGVCVPSRQEHMGLVVFPIRYICAFRQQCPVLSLKIILCSFLSSVCIASLVWSYSLCSFFHLFLTEDVFICCDVLCLCNKFVSRLLCDDLNILLCYACFIAYPP